MTALEEIGIALLVGGVRATARNQRRKLELQREGEWGHALRHNRALLAYIGNPHLTGTADCEARCEYQAGRFTTCVLGVEPHDRHCSPTGITWA